MKIQKLHKNWQMHAVTETELLSASVPGSVYNTVQEGAMMKPINKDELEFAIFCIESVAHELGLKGNEVYKLMMNCPGLNVFDDYVIAFYAALHTQGQEYIVRELIELMRKKGARI